MNTSMAGMPISAVAAAEEIAYLLSVTDDALVCQIASIIRRAMEPGDDE